MPRTKITRHLPKSRPHRVEWLTLGLFGLCIAVWAISVFVLYPIAPFVAMALLALALVLHSSLSHEVLHGHPFPARWASEALVHVNPGLFIPYLRFRDTHLAHHQDARLTDPYDDPESNYLDPNVWARLPGWRRRVLRANNTLLGRITLGPLIGQWAFMQTDMRLIRDGDRQVLVSWLVHLPGVVLVLWAVAMGPMPIWSYLLCCYVALSILKIRTFLEHQAHETTRGRTVIVEDRGILSFLFLNNNLHVVHHMHPRVPWYRLRALYEAKKQHYLRVNEGYSYASYKEVFAAHALSAKDPVAHPLWRNPAE
ncbi:MAG: fatty acid desaturase [Pseudomonadota bacterium]